MKNKYFKGQTIVEILVVFLLFGIIFRMLSFGMADLGWSVFTRNIIYMLWALIVPLLLIFITKPDIGLKNWKFGIHIAFLVFWLGFIQSTGFAMVGAMKVNFASLSAFPILVGSVILMILMALFIFSKTDENKQYRYVWKLVFFGLLFLIPVVVVGIGEKSIGKTLFYQLYFTFGVGFAEELMYRGYIQSRINSEFGRQWQIGKTKFGPGLIIASVLFGLAHSFPLGSKEPNLIFAAAAIFAGLFFGFVREKGGIWPAIAFHVLWSAIPEPIMKAYGIL